MKKLTAMILACGIMGFGLQEAGAAAQLRLSDGTTTVTIQDEGPGDVAAGIIGQVEYVGPVGPNWYLDVTVGTGDPAIGSPAAPAMDIGTANNSAGAGTLTIDLTQDGFTGGGAANLDVGGVTIGAVTYSAYFDPTNLPFAKTTLLGTVGPLVGGVGGGFSGSAVGVAPQQATPYSITMETTIQHSNGGHTGFDASLIITPPPCNCTLTFNSPTSITNCAGDAIPDVVATQDCGNGPVSVPVTFVGAVTNGSCPKVITRTNSATDNCGGVHTFVQTVTVNCLPDCKITPSVTDAVVGGSNYTASVASAGPGATYLWYILNGSITAGQGTPNITWAAGTDTNSPITIVVTITAATGCQSTCSASVRLTPKPPQICLGHGDTATIGFWHNKNGQALILSAPNQPALGNWLASNFPCMFGNLAGKSNSVVAALFMTDFGVKGQKTYAQVLAGAFACYFTSSNLSGNGAAQYGFNVTPGGTGAKVFNVGSLGTTIGLQNNTSYTVLQILQAANNNCPFNANVFNALNTIFDGINTTGDIN